jgi:glycosyltransferase involved in cell wall biosynthesis
VKILAIHNRYRQRGGEDVAVEQETALLRSRGHEVIEFVESNQALGGGSALENGWNAVWSRQTVSALRRLIEQHRPDLAHFHNTFARISPAAYSACRHAGVPVVQTLHNYRIGCLNAGCARDGAPCETCVPKLIPVAGIARGCYRGSRRLSLGMAAITTTHKLLGTYREQVDAYIALSEFARDLHIRSGVPASRIFVKPNFAVCGPDTPAERSNYALFVGRLCGEKGLPALLKAWEQAPLPLRIVGDGPDAPTVIAAAQSNRNVEWLGARPRNEVLRLMRTAQFLVLPSVGYENCGLCIVEAFSTGLPCIVSGLGSLREIVEDGSTGLHFEPGNPQDLRSKVEWMVSHPAAREAMGKAASVCFSERFGAERNYHLLMDIYAAAMAQFKECPPKNLAFPFLATLTKQSRSVLTLQKTSTDHS